MKTIKYVKPSGKEIEVNDDEYTRHYAITNGWEKVKPKPKQKPKEDKEQQLDKLI